MGNESEFEITVPSGMQSSINIAVERTKSKKEYASYSEVEKEQAIRDAVEVAAKTKLKDSGNLDRVIEQMDEREIPSLVMKASNLGQGIELRTEHTVDMQTAQKASETIMAQERTEVSPTIETMIRIGSETAGLAKISFGEEAFREKVVDDLSADAAKGYINTAIHITDEARDKLNEAVRQAKPKLEASGYTPEQKEQERRKVIEEAAREDVRNNLASVVETIDSKDMVRNCRKNR